jgi:hypothetical protein
MKFDIHMSNNIWILTGDLQSLQDYEHIFFQLFFLIRTINSFEEVYNYLKVETKDKKLPEILKEHLIVVIM